jgi:hypothetical protein
LAVGECPDCAVQHSLLPDPTRQIERAPTTIRRLARKRHALVSRAPVLLQFLPSGTCITLALDQPVILGRHFLSKQASPPDLLDLMDLDALRHGVSRQHCLLRRAGTQLILTDLNSTNGTYLNGERVMPTRDYVVADDDRLILGTLHLIIFFDPSAPT